MNTNLQPTSHLYKIKTLDQRVVYLDAIRGIAAIVVVISHYLLCFYPAFYLFNDQLSHTPNNLEASIGLSPLNIFLNGSNAVNIFFVLSGYVLSLRFFKDQDVESVYSGIIKRYFRLGIPIFASVFLAYILYQINAYYNVEVAMNTKSSWLSDLWSTPLDFNKMLNEGIYKNMFIGGKSEFNIVLWTMKWEFYGSVFLFAFLALFGKMRNRWFFYLIVLYIYRDSNLFTFFLGVLLCDYFNSRWLIKFHWIANMLLAFLALYISTYQQSDQPNIWSILDKIFSYNNQQKLSSIGSFIFLFVVLNSISLKNILSKNTFHYLGKISFSLYVIHILIIGSISCKLFDLLRNEYLMSYHLSFIVMFILSIPILLVTSHLFYKLIDKNGIKFSEFLYKRFFKIKPE